MTYRDEDVPVSLRKSWFPLDEDTIIMEIKAPGKKPDWLQAILDKHGLERQKSQRPSCAYHKSQVTITGHIQFKKKGGALLCPGFKIYL